MKTRIIKRVRLDDGPAIYIVQRHFLWWWWDGPRYPSYAQARLAMVP